MEKQIGNNDVSVPERRDGHGKCPQQLPIPDLLEEVKSDMEGWLTKPMMGTKPLIVRMERTTWSADALATGAGDGAEHR